MFRLRRSALLIQTLAHCIALRTFGSVHYVTDDFGLEISERLGWRWTSLGNSLQSIPEELLHLWAIGKAYALREQTGPAIHIDGDVFVHKMPPERFLRGCLFAQSVDFPNYYLGEDMEKGFEVTGLARGRIAYNAGLIGGADISLVHEWADGMIGLARKFAAAGHPINGTTESMIAEQYWLGSLAHDRNVRVETLLRMRPSREEWREAGYTHLHGSAKREPYYLYRAEERLKSDFPDAYKYFLLGCDDLIDEFDAYASAV
jgi:hypothetical protein